MEKKSIVSGLVLGGIFLAAPFSGILRAEEPWPGFPALQNDDANGDQVIDLSDGVYLLRYLYMGGAEPAPMACGWEPQVRRNGDSNGDGSLDVSDAIHLLGWLFGGGSRPAIACGGGSGGAANKNPGILPPNSSAYGKTFGEWTAAWWQWAISIPVPSNPLFDNAGCDAGQSGKVWFLGGAFTGTAVTRECTVPHGKAILFPIANVECSTVEPPPFFGSNEEELRACAMGFQDAATGMSATIDGREVLDLDRYRVQSPLFDFSAPADNVFFIPGPVSGQSVSDGVWLLLAPLSAGEHVIHFEAFPGFPINVTYILTVL